MDFNIQEKIGNSRPMRWFLDWTRQVTLPGFDELTLYDLGDIYLAGLLKGTFSSRAGSIAFSFFMAIFPALLFLLNLIPFVPIRNFQLKFLAFIYELMPSQSVSFFRPILTDISQNGRTGLLSFSAVLGLFLTANGVNAIFSGFEKSYNVSLNRGFFRQYGVALGVSIILAALLLVGLIVLIYIEYSLYVLNERDFMSEEMDIILLSVARYLFLATLIYVVIATLYHFGTKESRKTRFFSPGALMTTLLFLLTTVLFGIYIDNFSSYNELYGSIGALLIMMLYIWLNSNLLLLGFELNAALYKVKFNQNPKNK